MLTPVLIVSPLKIHGTFYLVSGALVAAFLFVLFTLPETKVMSAAATIIAELHGAALQALSLERINTVFALPWSERTQVLHYLK